MRSYNTSKEALVRCKYHRWGVNKVQKKVINGNQEEIGNTHVSNTMQDSNGLGNNSQTPATPGGRPSMGTHCHSICTGPGGKYEAHML